MKPKAPGPVIKPEPGTEAQMVVHQQQQHAHRAQLWQHPQQPSQQNPAAPAQQVGRAHAILPVMTVILSVLLSSALSYGICLLQSWLLPVCMLCNLITNILKMY